MAIVLALFSALMYGVSDFVGGRASRHFPATAVALVGEVVVLLICLVSVPVAETQDPTSKAFWWGLVAGATGSIAIVGLYLALARGNMTVVAPVTGVVAAVIPVVVGVALGERPSVVAVVGILLAIAAVALIGGLAEMLSGADRPAVEVTTLVLAAGVGLGFGLLFVALAQPGEEGGLWPLLFARFTGVPVLVIAYLLQFRGRRKQWLEGVAIPGVAIGVLIAGANVTFLLATRQGLLSLVAVVVAMYPASTICLAAAIDGERATRSQVAGMALAAGALVLITTGS